MSPKPQQQNQLDFDALFTDRPHSPSLFTCRLALALVPMRCLRLSLNVTRLPPALSYAFALFLLHPPRAYLSSQGLSKSTTKQGKKEDIFLHIVSRSCPDIDCGT